MVLFPLRFEIQDQLAGKLPVAGVIHNIVKLGSVLDLGEHFRVQGKKGPQASAVKVV